MIKHQASGEVSVEEDGEVVDEKLVLEGEAMIGEEIDRVEDEQTGEQQEVRSVKASVAPKLPSKKDIEQHNLTHLTYRSWCQFYVACKKPNLPHKRQWEERAVPLLVGDYAFIRSSQDAESTTL